MFIREGTPSGFKQTSRGVPSSRYGMSSTGRIRATTPLLPWRPAILSPTRSFLLSAITTFTTSSTPGLSSSPADLLRRWMSITTPSTPCGSLREVSRTSFAFSPKIEFKSLNSGVFSVSLFGVTFPTRMSPLLTFAPTRTIPSASRFFSEVFGTSRVIFSGPSFVSRISVWNSWMWTEVYMSSLTTRWLIRTASS